ncbi:MAG: pyridoxamine 5'-phosphate oxidase family protein [bacterium]|nr:pyridoxamine 5'-phosphate oxidase family protein [bacterium]
MSRIEGSELSPELLNLLDGKDLDSKVGETILLLTVSDSGWPHLAMLSAGELLATRPGEVRIALWKGTTTGNNLRRTSKGTLALVHGGASHYIELEVTGTADLRVGSKSLDYFACRVTKALSDAVGYATLTSGIRFELPRRDDVVSRWERTVAAMREA